MPRLCVVSGERDVSRGPSGFIRDGPEKLDLHTVSLIILAVIYIEGPVDNECVAGYYSFPHQLSHKWTTFLCSKLRLDEFKRSIWSPLFVCNHVLSQSSLASRAKLQDQIFKWICEDRLPFVGRHCK